MQQQTNQNALYQSKDVPALIKTHHHYLKNFVLRLTHNQELTEDILQETYIQAIKSIERFEGRSQIKTWLAGIALNMTRHYKKNQRYHVNDETVMNLIADCSDGPEENLAKSQSLEKISQVFQIMPENMAQTAYLVLCENISYQQAADTMNIPIGTVRSRISRARALLEKVQKTN